MKNVLSLGVVGLLMSLSLSLSASAAQQRAPKAIPSFDLKVLMILGTCKEAYGGYVFSSGGRGVRGTIKPNLYTIDPKDKSLARATFSYVVTPSADEGNPRQGPHEFVARVRHLDLENGTRQIQVMATATDLTTKKKTSGELVTAYTNRMNEAEMTTDLCESKEDLGKTALQINISEGN